MRPRLVFAVLLAMPANAPPAAAEADPYRALRNLDSRMVAVGTRLATANLPLCQDRQWQPGIALHDRSQYGPGSRAAAVAAFRLGAFPAVMAVAPAGGAARAGLRADDAIEAADGTPLPRAAADAPTGFGVTGAAIEALERAFADGVADLIVRRDGALRTIRVAADQGCASRFQVVPSARRDALADGQWVQLTGAMIEYTSDEDELAALVAHELAHNILRHRARLNAAGVQRGLLAPFGRNGRLFRQVETEADRLAVHLMARAGFDPAAAVRLWTRQGRGDSRLFAGTHPAWPTRIRAVEEEIAAIAAARASGRPAVPPISHAPLDGRPRQD